jgi:hypothetical protein
MDNAFWRAEREYLEPPDDNPFVCDICGRRSHNDDLFVERGVNDYICTDCAEEWGYKQCLYCGFYFDEDRRLVDGGWFCKACIDSQ